ncbi:enhancer of polycomb homolog 1 [Cylas formicarius]|uniref:enhancer of polycomb homolog 1 n=1 Tax=Cylas formicarius TaxID=197179 RepID=UPI0029589785|nr:enhancer of polycomb homolog 1 [Cylas formicarius]
MSKLSFRARALDASKPMPIYMAEELPDLPDFSAINRAVPQMPSGMQKEEECEHHLQRAICAGLIIPTPEVTDVPLKDFYDRVYPSNYKMPRQLIHMQPFTMEQDIPDYDMDSDDERWLQTQAPKLDLSPAKFEEMMDRLEKSSGQTVISLNEAKALLKEDDDLIIAVFDYWLNKRLKTKHPLILSVRNEHRVGTAPSNPYLAFRRRTEKMQTRKNRKNDEVSYEKMLKLRRDLYRAVTLLELVKRREKIKREYVHLTVEVFEKRFQARDFSGSIVAEAAASKPATQSLRPAFTPIFHNHYPNQGWAGTTQAIQSIPKNTIKDELVPRREKRQYKKRKHKSMTGRGLSDSLALSSDEDEAGPAQESVSSEPGEEGDLDGQYAFRRNKLCSYHMPLPTLGNWPWCSQGESGLGDKRFRFTLTSLRNPKRCIGFARRRVGRGGRIILDRVSTEYDDFWRGLDFTITEPAKKLSAVSKEEEHLRDSGVDLGNVSWSLKSRSDSQRTGDSVLLNCGSESFTSDFVGSNSSSCGLRSNSLSSSVSGVKVEYKMEHVEEDGVSNLEDAGVIGSLQEKHVNQDDRDNMVETLRSVRRNWLHFRPKTPSPTWEPPCFMLPPDDPPFTSTSIPPFSMEVQPLDPSSSSLLQDQSPFFTDLFDLERRWVDADVADTEGSSSPYNQDFYLDYAMEDSNVDTVGVSKFTLIDAGGMQIPAFEDKPHRIQKKLGTEKIMGSVGTHQAPTEVGSTNGLITQVEFPTEAPSSNCSRTNKLTSYAYSNPARGSSYSDTAPSILSLLTSAQSVTLNSHSANSLLDLPMDVDDSSSDPLTGVSSTGVNHSLSPTSKTNGGATAPGNSTKPSLVRNNKNNIVMEVT